jgi:hypothetical protein
VNGERMCRLLAGSMLARLAGARAILPDGRRDALQRLSTARLSGQHPRVAEPAGARPAMLTDGDVISAETLDAALALESEPLQG